MYDLENAISPVLTPCLGPPLMALGLPVLYAFSFHDPGYVDFDTLYAIEQVRWGLLALLLP